MQKIILSIFIVTLLAGFYLIQSQQQESELLTLSGTAGFTWYESYPRCCKDSPNYDPNAPTAECVKYSGCKWKGRSMNQYCGKQVRMNKNGVSITATVADTCSDSDCGGCCTQNAKNGYLIDIEYYTAKRAFGSTGAVTGTVDFQIL